MSIFYHKFFVGAIILTKQMRQKKDNAFNIARIEL